MSSTLPLTRIGYTLSPGESGIDIGVHYPVNLLETKEKSAFIFTALLGHSFHI